MVLSLPHVNFDINLILSKYFIAECVNILKNFLDRLYPRVSLKYSRYTQECEWWASHWEMSYGFRK